MSEEKAVDTEREEVPVDAEAERGMEEEGVKDDATQNAPLNLDARRLFPSCFAPQLICERISAVHSIGVLACGRRMPGVDESCRKDCLLGQYGEQALLALADVRKRIW